MTLSVSQVIDQAVALVGSEAKLGAAAGGFSQNAIWQAKRRNRITAELALGIHRATLGKVPASLLRPDIWASPEAVPQQVSFNAACTPAADDTAAHGGAASPDPIPETSAQPPLDHESGDRADASPGTAG